VLFAGQGSHFMSLPSGNSSPLIGPPSITTLAGCYGMTSTTNPQS